MSEPSIMSIDRFRLSDYDPWHSARWIAALARRFLADESGCVPNPRNPLVLFVRDDVRLLIEVTPFTLSPEVARCGTPAVAAATYIEALPHLERAGFVQTLA